MMLLDTSGLFCYHHRAESQHADAVIFFDSAPIKLTHNYVLAEFVPLCQVRKLNRTAVLSFVADLLDNPLVEVVWVDEWLHRTATMLLQAQLDKTYSLCDAVSFVLMHERNIREALTTDRHFEQAGFRTPAKIPPSITFWQISSISSQLLKRKINHATASSCFSYFC